MKIIILLVIAVLFFCSVFVRVLLLNLPLAVKDFIKDIFDYFVRYRFNNIRYGGLICFQGNFGHGKTLSAVHHVTRLYNRYNNTWIFDKKLGKVKQYVQVLTNVQFNNIPYVKLESLKQIVDLAKNQHFYDQEHNIITKTIVLIDESSCYLNSRQFKNSIDPVFLNTLIQNRKANITHFYYCSQKFNLTDKLMRDVTEQVINCKKVWRIMIHYVYDPSDLEQTANLSNLKPLRRYGWYIKDCDYNNYSTTQLCNRLITACENNDFISETDILALQQGFAENVDNVRHKSFKLKRRK